VESPQNFVPGVWDSKQPSLGFTEIPLPVGFVGGHAHGINDFGVIVGTCSNDQPYNSAYIYQNGASTDLNTLIPPNYGWHLVSANDINNRGEITGDGRWYNMPRAFVLSVPQTLHVSDLVAFLLLGALTAGGAGTAILPGGPRPVDPSGPVTFFSLPAPKRDALIALALDEAARFIGDDGARASIRRAALEAARERINALLESGEYREGAPLVQEDVTFGLDASVSVSNLELGKSRIDLLRHGILSNT
jgi:probable HAF family extracellular repeat protein